MSDVSATQLSGKEADITRGSGEVKDYFALLKPRVMSLVVLTALAGIVVAPGALHPWLAAMALLAISVGAGAAGALNMWYDADIDARMRRTAQRPLPRGAIEPGEALGFGMTLAAGSVVCLGMFVNWTAAAFLAFTIFFYAVVYTMWLKRWTAQNIVIGGAAGAFPPMIGWTAVTGSIDWTSASLFLLIFLWTPPHFWALALLRSEDYARVGVPMLPVVAGARETRRQILIYSVLMTLSAFLPVVLGIAGSLYLASAAVLGLGFLWHAVDVHRLGDREAGRKAAGKLFGFSIFYLFSLFAALIVERLLGLHPFAPIWG